MTFKSVRENIELIATTFSRKDKSSSNISPLLIQRFIQFQYILKWEYPLHKVLMGMYVTLWDQFLTEGVGFEPTVPLQIR